jgi:hypothetical protein
MVMIVEHTAGLWLMGTQNSNNFALRNNTDLDRPLRIFVFNVDVATVRR